MANAMNSLTLGGQTGVFTLPYGECSTAANTAAKTVTVDNFSLETGAIVVVKFTNKNSAASPTLNVNGTGAKSIMRYGTTAVSTSDSTSGWVAGAVTLFVYDGTNWVRDYWNNSTYSNVSLGQGYATCSTAEATTAKVGTLSSYTLATGGIVSVKFTYAVPASATLNINSKGAKSIYYRGAAITANVIKAGDIATFMYNGQYHLLAIDRWQSDLESLQAALEGKAASSHDHVASDITSGTLSADRLPTVPISKGGTGATTAASALTNLGITATAAELNKLDGVTATTAELNYVDGVTSNIQTQLNAKVPTSRTVNGKALSSDITLSASDVGAISTSGGNTISNPNFGQQLQIYRSNTSTGDAVIRFANDAVAGYLGILGVDGSPVYYDKDAAVINRLIHSGNISDYAASISHTHDKLEKLSLNGVSNMEFYSDEDNGWLVRFNATAADGDTFSFGVDKTTGIYAYKNYEALWNIPISHTHTASEVGALPISGGTLTGDLYVKDLVDTAGLGVQTNVGDLYLYYQQDGSRGLFDSQAGAVIYFDNNTPVFQGHAASANTAANADNANYLCGYSPDGFMKSQITPSNDLTSLTVSGVYRVGEATNGPSQVNTSYGQVLVLHGAYDTIAQLAFPYQASEILVRSGAPSAVGGSGSYNDWRRVVTDGNISEYAISTSGGNTISNPNFGQQLQIYRSNTSTGDAVIRFANDAVAGYLGILGVDGSPVYYDKDAAVINRLIHSGNISDYISSSGGSAGMIEEFNTGLMSVSSYSPGVHASRFYIITLYNSSTVNYKTIVFNWYGLYYLSGQHYYKDDNGTTILSASMSNYVPTFTSSNSWTIKQVAGYY